MNGMMSILSMLISLAMMLTGAGEGADLSRTATISNLTLTVNDQTVTLNPSLSLGARSNGEMAIFDLAMDLNGEKLFPVQILADAEKLTAAMVNANTAFSVPAETLDQLSQAGMSMVESSMQQDPESAKLIQFLTQELLPAYMDVIELAKDPEASKALQDAANAKFDELIDRGEGTESTLTLDETEYAVTEYHYTMTNEDMVNVAEAVYHCDDRLSNLYDKLFEFYGMLPEESGLTDIHSFSDVFEKTGVTMSAEVDERISEADDLDDMDMVMTITVPAQEVTSVEVAEGTETETEETQTVETIEVPPMVMNIHTTKLGDKADAQVDMDYAIENQAAMMMKMTASTEGSYGQGMMVMSVNADGADIEMTMDVSQTEESSDAQMAVNATNADGSTVAMSMNANETPNAEGGSAYTVNGAMEATGEQGGSFSFSATGEEAANGTSSSDVALIVDAAGTQMVLSFNVSVTDETIEDAVSGIDAIVIDDLENLNSLTEDENFAGCAAQIMGSVYTDAGKLMNDDSVKQLLEMFTAVQESVTEETTREASGEEDADAEETYEYEEPEDDGVLAFNEPEFTYLPEGWSVSESNVDTVYDNVDMTINNESGDYAMGAYFYGNYDDGSVPYALDEDGNLVELPRKQVRVNDQGDGMWSVEISDAGVNGSLFIYSDAITVEEIGKIVAGLTY